MPARKTGFSEGKTSAELTKLDFEEALGALEEIVQDLESGNSRLEDAIALYEKGVALKKHCEAKLREAEAKIEKITLDGEGKPSAAPLDPDSS